VWAETSAANARLVTQRPQTVYKLGVMVSRDLEERFGRDLVEPLLKRVLWVITLAASLIAVTAGAFGVTRIVISSVVNAVVAGAMIGFVRRGWLHSAALIESFVLTASAVYAIAFGYGLLDISILILPSLFLLTSVLLSARWILVVVVVTNAIVVSIGLAEKWGWLVTPNSRLVQYDDIIDAAILLTTTAAFVQYLVSTLRRSIVQARSAQARTRDILDATSDAIVIHDAKDGRITEVNESTLEMFGCSRADLLSQVPTATCSKRTADYVKQAMDYVHRAVTSGSQSFEWMTRDSLGNDLWIEAMLRAANVGDEQCVVAVLRDITLRRRLEQRVRETEKLRVVGQLAGGIAHDFNNQLVGMLGNAEFILDAAGCNDEIRASAESIMASGQRAADLTRQLLAFARRARRQNLPVDIHQLIAEVIALARRSIDKRIGLERQLAARCATTVGDASALQNALLNLLLNARDAMPEGGTIRFETRNVEIRPSGQRNSTAGLLPGKYIEVQVTDTGSGIEPDIIGKIFEPFFTTKGAGTGMGLAAVQGTVLEHQGTVEVKSQVGHGSTFGLWLPVSNETLDTVEPLVSSSPSSVHNRGQILVVDDEPSVLSVIRHALERGGYEISCCNEGRKAVELYQNKKFDLVLLNVMMPDLDGVEVLRHIRAANSKARVLIMTGHAPESVQARLRDFPDVTVLAKPFLPKEVLQEVQVVLGQCAPN
jgi:PAS domain S-box-containing protein